MVVHSTLSELNLTLHIMISDKEQKMRNAELLEIKQRWTFYSANQNL